MEKKAYKLGASYISRSNRKGKKYMVIYNDVKIHFGNSDYDDYTIHKDKERRRLYRARASRIKDKYGNLTYLNKYSPNYWSYHLLW